MGATHSQPVSKGKGTYTKKPEPEPDPDAEPPYPGPPAQYQFVNTEVTFSVRFPQTNTTSDINTYYPILGEQYAQGYRLLTFYRIQGQAKATGGFFSATVGVPFQGIFCRYPDVSTHEKWHLHVEKSTIQIQCNTSGFIINTRQSLVSDTSHIMESITRNTQEGGRLICIEMTGQHQSQPMRQAFSGLLPVMGVDLFFEKPEHPLPEQYVYNCVSVPVHWANRGVCCPVPVVQCDWLEVLAQNLNQGWGLIEIFMDMSCSKQVYSSAFTLNTMWFFEKPASRINDLTPVYEGIVVPHAIKIKVTVGGTTTSAHWEPVIEKMGSRGWELACILETPEIYSSGMCSFTMKCLLFFQRRILPPVAAAPGAVGFNCMPAGYGQVQPDLVQPPAPTPELT